jgi:hypothetical protein
VQITAIHQAPPKMLSEQVKDSIELINRPKQFTEEPSSTKVIFIVARLALSLTLALNKAGGSDSRPYCQP